MKQKQFVASGIIISIAVALFIAIIIEPTNIALANRYYTLAGLGFFIFGIWGAILLFQNK